MSYKLYLDDIRPLPDSSWILVKSYEEFTGYIDLHGLPEVISFDHDLADEHYPWNDHLFCLGKLSYNSYVEKTGYDCVKWLVDYYYNYSLPLPPYIYFHTQNPIGKRNMEAYLDNARKHLNL